jgi:hypothetical protein
LSGLASTHDPTDLCLLSSWDYRREPQAVAFSTFLTLLSGPSHKPLGVPKPFRSIASRADGEDAWELLLVLIYEQGKSSRQIV